MFFLSVATHIIPETQEHGEPVVPNGASLCALHRAMHDRQFLGVWTDHVVKARRDPPDLEDGAMLLQGLNGMHVKPLFAPTAARSKPDPGRFKVRWERFRAAA